MRFRADKFDTDNAQLKTVYDWIVKNRPTQQDGLRSLVQRFGSGLAVAVVFPFIRDRHPVIGDSQMQAQVGALLQLAYVKGPGSLLDDGLLEALENLCSMEALPRPTPVVADSSPVDCKSSPQQDSHHANRNADLLFFLKWALADGRIPASTVAKAEKIFDARAARKTDVKGRDVSDFRPSPEQVDAVLLNLQASFTGHKKLVMDSFTRQLRSNHGRGAPLRRAPRQHVVWDGAVPVAITVKAQVGNKWYTPYFVAEEDRKALLDLWHGSPYQGEEDPLYYLWHQADKDRNAEKKQPARALSDQAASSAFKDASHRLDETGIPQPLMEEQLRVKHFRPSGHRRMAIDAGLSDAEIEAVLNRAPGTQMTIRYTDVIPASEMVRWMAGIRGLPFRGPKKYHAKCRSLLDTQGRCTVCDGASTAIKPITMQSADLLTEIVRRRQAEAGAS